MRKFLFANFFVALLFLSCSVVQRSSGEDTHQLTFLGEYILPHKLQYKGTTVGGLSGIDYDSKKDVYYLICDDRSDINPARFYTARIHFSQTGIDSVTFDDVTTLRQAGGMSYPNRSQDRYHVSDPEAIRYHPLSKTIVWSSEGERIVKKDTVILINPSVNLIESKGNFLDTFSLPANMRMSATMQGPRQNGTFEGLTFTSSYKTLYVSLEEPLYEDGPRAGTGDSSAWVRIIKYDFNTRKPLAQFAYRIDPVVQVSHPPSAFKINGITEILALNDHQLIVVERSFSSGKNKNNVRVYVADLRKANDVSAIHSLQKQNFRSAQKRLLLNMDDLGLHIDNIEGVSFGPLLPNGKRSLVFIADDNFSPAQKNQLLLFQVN